MPPAVQASINLNAPAVAATLDELLVRHDQAFIHCAYQTLLGRDPDEEGLNYYLARLRTGIPKIQILAQLRRSDEGKAYAANLPRLDAAIRRYYWTQNAIIGWLLRRFTRVADNNTTDRKLRSLESQLFLLGEESNRCFDQMEKTVTALHHLVTDQIEQIKAAVATKAITARSEPAQLAPPPPAIQISEPEGLKQLSPRARNIYFQLKTAVAIHTRRPE